LSNSPKNAASYPGAHSLTEILSQPQCWQTNLDELRKKKTLQSIADRFAGTKEWLFIGCGSSFYVAQSAASTITRLTNLGVGLCPHQKYCFIQTSFWLTLK